jgi:very-short-patch-repair endonuclease
MYNKLILKPRRRELRQSTTPAEIKIWNIIRNRKINNLKFIRQYSVGFYILDFYCPKIRLAIEIDGGQHNDPDQKRRPTIRRPSSATTNQPAGPADLPETGKP